ncbi:MAG: transposase, partial [Gemmatimonadota bacterium]|nr:transposase [Gemmatimonadota bacterium]
MPQLADPIIPVLAPFRPLFAPRTWPKALLLVRGTLLVRGRRTVAAALRVMGHATDPAWTLYHQVLNRAVWSPLAVSRVLLLLLIATFLPPTAPVEIVIDEHLERRWGPRILKRGHYRDALRSSKTRSVSTSGLSWICVMLLVPVPWTDVVWALPFLTILLTPPAVDRAAHRRHKTLTRWTQQVVTALRRWLPQRAIIVLGDGHYSSLDLGNTAVAQRVQLVAPLRLDAALFAPAPPRRPGQRGA